MLNLRAILTGLAMGAGAMFFGQALAGPGYWTSNGPNGGVTYEVQFDPTTPTRMYAGTRGGLYRSFTGGTSWTRANNGLPESEFVTRVALDGAAPLTLYTFGSSRRVFRSLDGGDNWAPTGFVGPEDFGIRAMKTVQGAAGELFIILAGDEAIPGSRLLRSNDGGASFAAVGTGIDGVNLNTIDIDPDDPLRILVGASFQQRLSTDPVPPSIFLSTDGGANFAPVFTWPIVPTGSAPMVLQVAFGADDRVYALVQGTLYASNDRGSTWSAPLAASGTNMLPHPVDADTVYLADQTGLMISTDGGASSIPIGSGLTSNPTYTSSLDGVTPAHAEVLSIVAHPGFPTAGTPLWVATQGGGLFRSNDLGANWSRQNVGLLASNIRAVAIHPNPSTADAVLGASTHIFAGFADVFLDSPSLHRSEDFGNTWIDTNSGLRAAHLRSLLIDHTTAGLSAAEVFTTHIYASGRASVATGYRNGGLYKSTDGGLSWSDIDTGLPTREFGGETAVDVGTVRTLMLDPRSCAAPPPDGSPCDGQAAGGAPLQHLYATATGHPNSDMFELSYSHMLIRSVDAGASWADFGTGTGFPVSEVRLLTVGADEYRLIEPVTPIGIAMVPDDPDTIYLSTFLGNLACTVRTAGSSDPFEPCADGVHESVSDPISGIFKTTDGGTSWVNVSNGLPRFPGFSNTVVSLLTLAMHPTNPDILWTTAVDLVTFDPVPGVYKTVDGGMNWFEANEGIPLGTDIRALLVDPGDPSVLYAAGSGRAANPGSVFKSEDGGLTWRSISVGLPASSATSLALDPINATILHAGTTSGLWSIQMLPDADGDGVPDGVENLAPNGGDGNNDGIPDAVQGAVGSTVVLFNRNETQKGGGGFTTAELVAGTEGTCAQIVDVEVQLAARYGRDFLQDGFRFHRYPRDLIRFEALDCGSATVDLIFHNASFAEQVGWTARFYGPATPGDDDTIAWHDISARAELVSPTTWRMFLDANAFGSYRPEDDRILFIGGPACDDYRFIENGFENDQPLQRPSCRN